MRMPRAGWVGIVALALVVASIGLVIAWFVMGRDIDRSNDLDTARVAALDAGQKVAVDINSYDYATIDRQFTVVEPELTGAVLENFRTTKDAVRSGFTKDKISSSAQVLASGSESSGTADGTVLIWLSVTRTTNGQRATQQAPLRIHLVKQGSTWRADTITTVG